MTLTEQERIENLVRDGKISRAEGDLLLEALNDIDSVDAELDSQVANAHRYSNPPSPGIKMDIPPMPPTPPTPPTPPSPPGMSEERSASRRYLPEGLDWIKIIMLAGDLDVRVEAGLERPEFKFSGEVNLEQDGRNYEVRPNFAKEGLLGGLMNVLGSLDMEIRVPEGYGIDLDSKAGDIDVRGVRFLKGQILAGDVTLRDIGGLDLDMKAGDLDVRMCPTEGEHRIEALAGSISVRLQKGSDVRVSGSIKAGNAEAKGPFRFERHTVGSRFEGSVGAGNATLDIRMKAGNLEVKVED